VSTAAPDAQVPPDPRPVASTSAPPLVEPARVFRFGPGALATPANAITMARLLLAIPTVLLIEDRGASWLTVGLWFVLSCTDGLDGWVARRDGTTRSGAYLDPLADKSLVLGGFVALALRGAFGWLPVVLVAGRELAISAYRSLAGRRGISLPARMLGKVKANVQLVAVGVVIFPPFEDLDGLHQVLLWVAVSVTLLSALDIVGRGWREAREAR
jgi:CDP-diacylglycerol---glycerol-3-phosphate 3-phosphatidyltransferase